MEILHQLLGEHSIDIWIAGMFWSLLGILAVKIYFLNAKVKFSLKFWLNDNLIDVVKGLIWALIILRMGDYAIHLLIERFDFNLPETTDFVIYMILISGAIQYRLHKNRTPISKKVDAEMHIHNEQCKH